MSAYSAFRCVGVAFVTAVFACALPVLVPQANAQTIDTVAPPGSGIPGATREEFGPSLPPDGRLRRAEGEVAADEDEAPTPEVSSALSFKLNGVNLTGATVYETEDFSDILENFVGKDVTLGGLREIGNRIERKYRDDGYVATRVIIPPQAIKDGTPTLEVFEGKIIHYEINGEIGDVKKLIARYLDNLLTDEPAKWSELERYLLISRDLPGISLTGTLRSAGDSTPGGVILVVDAARKPVDIYINGQNRNAEVTGPWTTSAGVSFNSNTEFGERLGAVGLMAWKPFEQKSAYVVYEHALGDEGLRLKASATFGFAKPGEPLKDLKLETDTAVFRFEIEYPAVRSREFSLWTRGGFDTADQRAVVKEIALFDDQVRAMFLGFSGVWFAPLGGVTEFDFELRKGLDKFGAPKGKGGLNGGLASEARSRRDANFDFTVAKGSISHRQPLPPFFELFVEASGQVASDGLPSIEEFALGTLSVGRGFEPGAITGDSGFGLIFEGRFSPPGIDLWWLDNLQIFGFVDYGRAYDFGNPTNSTTGYEDLLSVGFGTRFQLFETFFGEAYLAIPRTKALSTTQRQPNPTVHVSVTKFF